MTIDVAYIRDRIEPRIAWYDRRAVSAKRLCMLSQYVSVGLSVLIIVLIEIEPVPREVLAIIAALIALVTVSERVGQFGSRWQLYRLAAESLESETQLFRHRAGPYAAIQDGDIRVFVERTEALLRREAVQWGDIVEGGGSRARKGLFPTE